MLQAAAQRSSVAPYCDAPGAALQVEGTVVTVVVAIVVVVVNLAVVRAVAVVDSVIVELLMPPGTPKMH